VGGKTGVDTRHGKNLVGAFHPPHAVIADPQVLRTLPDRAFRGGLAEAVKHGVIRDREYFAWMEQNAEKIGRRDPDLLTRLIRRSIAIKAEVVSEDEREAGCRAILNAGHTAAHALERVSDFALAHGEAVALGLVLECQLAEELGIAQPGLRKRVTGLLERFGIPVSLPQVADHTALIRSMGSDKKNRDGRIHFALPVEIGRMHRSNGWTTPVSEAAIRRAITAVG
jgi:3-dehydroquinate synthetase